MKRSDIKKFYNNNHDYWHCHVVASASYVYHFQRLRFAKICNIYNKNIFSFKLRLKQPQENRRSCEKEISWKKLTNTWTIRRQRKNLHTSQESIKKIIAVQKDLKSLNQVLNTLTETKGTISTTSWTSFSQNF